MAWVILGLITFLCVVQIAGDVIGVRATRKAKTNSEKLRIAWIMVVYSSILTAALIILAVFF